MKPPRPRPKEPAMEQLSQYQAKRDFTKTAEPRGDQRGVEASFSYVIQKHDATRLHYDFRLELDGVLLSWAVPKGPSLDPSVKRLAVQVEDHPVDYASFEGSIPGGEYGGGTVMVWDTGHWTPEGDPRAALRKGRLTFDLHGKKLHGKWHLVRTKAAEKKPVWLLFKGSDEHVRKGGLEITDELTASVTSGQSLEEIAHENGGVLRSQRAKAKRITKLPSTDDGGAHRARARKTKPAERADAKRARTVAKPSPTKLRDASKLPPFIDPELAKLVDAAPPGNEWAHEVKLDGYRIQACVGGDGLALWSRNQKDWTERFPAIGKALRALDVKSITVDGEVVVFDEAGVTDFQGLQNSLSNNGDDTVYCVFDILHLNGVDVSRLPLEERKLKLKAALESAPSARIRYCEHIVGNGVRFFEEAAKLGLEGIISKRRVAPYRSGRGGDWLKIKCTARQEFVIGGYSSPGGSRSHLGALYLCSRDRKNAPLHYVGKVGTGFTAQSLKELSAALVPLERETPAFEGAPRGALAKEAHWVEPQLVAEVSYTSFTRDGSLRHPSFHGLRTDKPAQSIVLEQARKAPKAWKGKRHG